MEKAPRPRGRPSRTIAAGVPDPRLKVSGAAGPADVDSDDPHVVGVTVAERADVREQFSARGNCHPPLRARRVVVVFARAFPQHPVL